MTKLEGCSVSKGPQSISLRHAGYTGAQLKSYEGEPGPPEVIGTDREKTVKYHTGIKECSSKKVT